MYTPLARSGRAEGSQAGLLERDSAHETYMEVQQETESQQKGKPCTGINRPAGGVIAHFKAAVVTTYPAMVKPLKSPPSAQKMIPEKIMHQLCLFPMLKTPGLNYNPISQVKSFLPLTSPPLPSLALQRTEQIVKGEKD